MNNYEKEDFRQFCVLCVDKVYAEQYNAVQKSLNDTKNEHGELTIENSLETIMDINRSFTLSLIFKILTEWEQGKMLS